MQENFNDQSDYTGYRDSAAGVRLLRVFIHRKAIRTCKEIRLTDNCAVVTIMPEEASDTQGRTLFARSISIRFRGMTDDTKYQVKFVVVAGVSLPGNERTKGGSLLVVGMGLLSTGGLLLSSGRLLLPSLLHKPMCLRDESVQLPDRWLCDRCLQCVAGSDRRVLLRIELVAAGRTGCHEADRARPQDFCRAA